MNLAALATDLGDLAIAGSAGLFVAFWCATRLKAVLGLATLLCLSMLVVVIAVLKTIAAPIAPPPWEAAQWALTSGAPSGHAALATFVFGFSGWIFLQTGIGVINQIGAGVCLAAVLTVLVTRVSLHHHSVADVLAAVALAAIPLGLMMAALDSQAKGVRAPALELLVGLTVSSMLPLLFGVRLSGAAVF